MAAMAQIPVLINKCFSNFVYEWINTHLLIIKSLHCAFSNHVFINENIVSLKNIEYIYIIDSL